MTSLQTPTQNLCADPSALGASCTLTCVQPQAIPGVLPGGHGVVPPAALPPAGNGIPPVAAAAPRVHPVALAGHLPLVLDGCVTDVQKGDVRLGTSRRRKMSKEKICGGSL
jgi:hypothetical protein